LITSSIFVTLAPDAALQSAHARMRNHALRAMILYLNLNERSGRIHGRLRSFWQHSRMKAIRAFLTDDSGATAIEYGLIAAGISLAIIAVVNGLGTKLNTKFTSINSSLK